MFLRSTFPSCNDLPLLSNHLLCEVIIVIRVANSFHDPNHNEKASSLPQEQQSSFNLYVPLRS